MPRESKKARLERETAEREAARAIRERVWHKSEGQWRRREGDWWLIIAAHRKDYSLEECWKVAMTYKSPYGSTVGGFTRLGDVVGSDIQDILAKADTWLKGVTADLWKLAHPAPASLPAPPPEEATTEPDDPPAEETVLDAFGKQSVSRLLLEVATWSSRYEVGRNSEIAKEIRKHQRHARQSSESGQLDDASCVLGYLHRMSPSKARDEYIKKLEAVMADKYNKRNAGCQN